MKLIPLLLLLSACSYQQAGGNHDLLPQLSMSTLKTPLADSFANLALQGIVQEFPNKPSEVQIDASSAKTPAQMHPAFYGSFDWHSSVHGHWMLVRLLRLGLLSDDVAKKTRLTLEQHLNPEKMEGELDYFLQAHNKSYERMYGWAWYLRLCEELEKWPTDEDAVRWREALRPLEEVLVARVIEYLPKLTWPVRAGVHRNTAFALTHVWDYAKTMRLSELNGLINDRAREWFSGDQNWGWRFEPSGQDFLSSGLEEIDLMRRVLEPKEFIEWLQGFGLPKLAPCSVSDESDGHLVHLAGLNLSRAWCLRGLLSNISTDHPQFESLWNSYQEHRKRGLSYVGSGNYEGDHWLASFAVYMSTASGIAK